MILSPERVHLSVQTGAPVLSNGCTCFSKYMHLFFIHLLVTVTVVTVVFIKYFTRTYARTQEGFLCFLLFLLLLFLICHLPLDLRSLANLLGWICNPTVMSISIFNA